MGNKDIMIMCLVFILAGAFTASAQAMGGVDAAVEISKYFIPSQFIISGLFVVSALISLFGRYFCGTIAAVVPIAVALSQSMGLNPAVVIGATIGGAMFGDNLSLISDTTIASHQNTKCRNARQNDLQLKNCNPTCNFVCFIIYAANFTSEITKTAVLAPDIQALY